MLIKFWGTRGSVPVPGPATVRYGGNTSCIQILSAAGTLIVIDCGTGLRAFGKSLLEINPKGVHGHVLISHTHWDHIQGIPFFLPFFKEGFQWDVYGPKGLSRSIRDALAGQMQYTYFPVGLGHFEAAINYRDLLEGTFYINEVKVITRYLNHTALTCGFRIEVDGLVVVYACDHEPYLAALASGEREFEGQDKLHAEFISGADILIHDAQYSAEEYQQRIGWGHSSMEYALQVAKFAKVKKVFLTHHDPLSTDKYLDKCLQSLRDRFSAQMPDIDIEMAAEGQVIHLDEKEISVVNTKASRASAIEGHTLEVDPEQFVSVYSLDPAMAELFIQGAQANKIPVVAVNSLEEIKKQVQTQKLALVVIEHQPPLQDAVKLAERIREALELDAKNIPIVIVSRKIEEMPKHSKHVNESLVLPLTRAYVQTKMLAWFLRVSCRWSPAQLPNDEKERLLALHNLKVLDTASEERFDRITRLACALFQVPAAFISLVDAHRQWFKSVQGIEVKESNRDISFCAHAVYSRENLIIPDTLLDDRFADNPLVTQPPHLRFYAGCPLILPSGYCIGTLCIADTKPRMVLAGDIKLLEDLRNIAMEELLNHP